MATILSSCVTTSARKEWSAVTTVPPLMRIAMVVVPPASLGRVLRIRNLSVWSILHDVRGRCESAFQDKPLASNPDRLVKSSPRGRAADTGGKRHGDGEGRAHPDGDRKSTRLNSSH